MVAIWAQQQREAPTTPSKYRTGAGDAAAKLAPSGGPPPEPAVAPRLPSTRRVSWFLLRETASLSSDERTALAQIHQKAPELAAIQPFIREFHQALRQQDLHGFKAWRERARASDNADLRHFVAGLDRDSAAVEAAFRESWSNGPVEGQVNRLKLLKRQMYGRAGFELLRARVLSDG